MGVNRRREDPRQSEVSVTVTFARRRIADGKLQMAKEGKGSEVDV